MDKLPFFTDKFYLNQSYTIEVINLLLDEAKNLFDYHFSAGSPVDHLTINGEVPEAKKLVSILISDLDAYLAYQEQTHFKGEEDEIPLNALLMHHRDYFQGTGATIVWRKSNLGVKFDTQPKKRKEASHV